jgi:hypothetical protein
MSAKTPARPSAKETVFHEIELTFPYAADLIDNLKTEVPTRHRRYDADERVWRIIDPFKETAVALLLARFPDAQIPHSYARPARVTTKTLPVPSLPVAPRRVSDQPELDTLLARVSCPKCNACLEQPIRAHVETSARVAKSKRPPAELIAVCPNPKCRELLVLSFAPTVATLLAV